jgi:hypothetical protein
MDQYNNCYDNKVEEKEFAKGLWKNEILSTWRELTRSFHNNVVNMNEFVKSEKINLTLINKQTWNQINKVGINNKLTSRTNEGQKEIYHLIFFNLDA